MISSEGNSNNLDFFMDRGLCITYDTEKEAWILDFLDGYSSRQLTFKADPYVPNYTGMSLACGMRAISKYITPQGCDNMAEAQKKIYEIIYTNYNDAGPILIKDLVKRTAVAFNHPVLALERNGDNEVEHFSYYYCNPCYRSPDDLVDFNRFEIVDTIFIYNTQPVVYNKDSIGHIMPLVCVDNKKIDL